MNFPLRVILALVVIAAIAAIGVWGLVTVLRAESMTRSQRLMAVGGILLVMVALAAWMILLAHLLGLDRAHFPFGLNVAKRARHPVGMKRHQGRDGCGAASASRLRRRRSFFFMPMITSPSAHGSLASLGQYLKMTVGPPSISRGHYATFIPLECVHDVGAVAGEHNLRSPPKVSRAPNGASHPIRDRGQTVSCCGGW